ncbi:hypothetical protein [Streptomyces sp. NPDC050738]|uniref:hypothetical protein n=1 Tax=Streptomyces sp. NPDC050738 TaxID=3154744 RepID=UPI00341E0071
MSETPGTDPVVDPDNIHVTDAKADDLSTDNIHVTGGKDGETSTDNIHVTDKPA